MNVIKKLLMAGLLSISLIGISACSEKIDSSTDEKFDASLQLLIKDKTKDQVQEFQQGYTEIMNYAYAKTHNGEILNLKNILNLGNIDMTTDNDQSRKMKEMDKIVKSVLNNKTYDDVVKMKDEYKEKTDFVVKEYKK